MDVPDGCWGALKLNQDVGGFKAGQVFYLTGDIVTVGRAETCTIHLAFDTSVSGTHLNIKRPGLQSSLAVVTDQSTNGTIVGSQALKNQGVELHNGDTIFLVRTYSYEKKCQIVQSFNFAYYEPKTKVISAPVNNALNYASEVVKGKYRDLEMIGAGATSSVFRAVSCATGEDVAIKCMNRKAMMTDSPEAFENGKDPVQREILLQRYVHHPNIIRFIESFADPNGYVYNVLEYAHGGTLLQLLSQGTPLSEPVALSYFKQILDAVSYLHVNGIIHRDLKPENLLLNRDRTVIKVCDLGVARVLNPMGNASTCCGTVGYMAPEVFTGVYSKPADIWSLGCILYFMVVGHPFFHEFKGQPYEVARVSPQTFMPRNSLLSPSACDLILRLVVIDPSLRLTVEQIRAHPWYLGQSGVPDPFPEWLKENTFKIQADERLRFSSVH